jgi:hypothetical protein
LFDRYLPHENLTATKSADIFNRGQQWRRTKEIREKPGYVEKNIKFICRELKK